MENEITIDLDRIREALPGRANVILRKTKKSVPFIECLVYPHISEEDFEMCKEWQREIIGRDNILEFYTEETGSHWKVYLKRQVIEFIGASDDDINSFVGLPLVINGSLNKPQA